MATIINGHFSVLQPGGWFVGFVPSPALLTQLDQELSQAVNGDGGGTYAPATPIVIGGAGLHAPAGTTWDIAAGATFSVEGLLEILGGELAVFNAPVFFSGSTVVQVQGGASIQWQSGTSAIFGSGTTITMQNGSTLVGQQGASWQMSGELSFSSTAQLSGLSAGAGWFNTNGNGIVIFDGTNPKFLNARTRTIAQPLLPILEIPGTPSYSLFTGVSLLDVVNTTNHLQMTKVVNGATIDGFSIPVAISVAHVPVGRATVALLRNNPDGTQNTIATVNVPTGVAGTQTVSASGLGGSPGTVVDDSNYTYTLELRAESGGSAQPLIWYRPTLTFVNITQLGQF